MSMNNDNKKYRFFANNGKIYKETILYSSINSPVQRILIEIPKPTKEFYIPGDCTKDIKYIDDMCIVGKSVYRFNQNTCEYDLVGKAIYDN